MKPPCEPRDNDSSSSRARSDLKPCDRSDAAVAPNIELDVAVILDDATDGPPKVKGQSKTRLPRMDPNSGPGPGRNPTAQMPPSVNRDRGEREESVPLDIALYQAALKGNWETASSLLESHGWPIRMEITDAKETVLHIAAAAKHTTFVENLVKLEQMKSEDLEVTNEYDNTALCFAAASGVVRIAKAMVNKNGKLPNIRGSNEATPVLMAVKYKRKEMASFLFSKTDFQDLTPHEQIELLVATLSEDYYDIAFEILEKNTGLATKGDGKGVTALHVLARKPHAIGSTSNLSKWKTCIYSCFKGTYEKALMKTLARQIVEKLWKTALRDLTKQELSELVETPSRLLHDAASVGNVEFLIVLIRSYPDLIWKVDGENKSLFHIAVENRQDNVFSLLYEIGGLKDFIATYYNTDKGSNMLHLAGKIAAPHHLQRDSGAALQMRRELQWFKEVEKIVVSSHLDMRSDVEHSRGHVEIMRGNNPQLSHLEIRIDPPDRLTPRELFTKEHKQLLKDGEKWMKNTASSCTIVATLTATVVFAAALSELRDDAGIRQTHWFTAFAMLDGTAFVLSITSILIFLSILTTRYAEDDFLVSLPTKLLVGLLALFICLVCMVMAFSATFFMAYDNKKAAVPLALALMAILPVGAFCWLHFKLMVDIVISLFRSKPFKRRKRRLF